MPELEEILVDVWRQTLLEGAKYVQIGDEKYPVRETSRRRLKQVDFRFEDKELRGLEQNPDTKSRWAKMAREGKKVMQFLDGGRYVAVVVDAKMKTYARQHQVVLATDTEQVLETIQACFAPVGLIGPNDTSKGIKFGFALIDESLPTDGVVAKRFLTNGHDWVTAWTKYLSAQTGVAAPIEHDFVGSSALVSMPKSSAMPILLGSHSRRIQTAPFQSELVGQDRAP